MALPLPNLDTRRWADLVEEGRALIPRYAPQWSDHNIHDPGITLIELFAWLIEADIYRTNRIPPSHRRKFLQLIGFAPRPPQPARGVLRFAMKSGHLPVDLPAGLTLVANSGGMQIPFRLLNDLLAIDVELAAVQAFDGKVYIDQTRVRTGHFGFPAWPAWISDPSIPVPIDPQKQPALYLGLSNKLPVGNPVKFWFRFAGPGNDSSERQRLLDETQAAQADSLALTPTLLPKEKVLNPTALTTTPHHHSIRIVWDYWDGSVWQILDSTVDQVIDETRGFTLDGPVTFKLPTEMKPEKFGVVKDKLHYLRARLIAGPLDYLAIVLNIEINATMAEQTTPAQGTFSIRPGVLPATGEEPVPGKLGRLNIEIDKDGLITKLAFATGGDGPEALVMAYVPAKPSTPGILTTTLVLAGIGTGIPNFKLALPGAPVLPVSTRIWTISNGKLEAWIMRPDLDASGRTDPHFVLAAMTGEISFGDGERGRVVPLGGAILASFDRTVAGSGNVPASIGWQLTGGITDAFSVIENTVPASGGTDEENLDHSAGRATEVVWAHERLLDLCASTGSLKTLDGLARDSVLARAAPRRATTLIDYERLALDVPGAPVARARAWAGLDPGLPCLKAPGTVVVIVVPWLPAKRPMASSELLEAVRRYLDRRRLVGTRLVVVGPHYLEVTVRATLAVNASARSERVLEDVRSALDRFLDPLSGGPDQRGWPFGRNVYRSEILEVIDKVVGLDHVENLELIGDTKPPQCGNLCVGPLMLVTPGTHLLKLAENLNLKGGANASAKA